MPEHGTIRTRFSVGLAALATALVLAPTGTAAADTARDRPPVRSVTEQTAALVRPAIVALKMTFTGTVVDETGVPVGRSSSFRGTCTGFGVAADGHIATAGHCVDGGAGSDVREAMITGAVKELVTAHPELPARTVLEFALRNWAVRGSGPGGGPAVAVTAVTGSTAAGPQGQERPARVVDVRPFAEGDVALIDIDATDLPTLELGTDADVRVGAGLLSIGYPASADRVTDPSLEPSVKDGQVSGRRSLHGLPVYETSAALSQGMSGGPTVDLDGRVLGVNSFMPADEPQAFNFIAPASGLAALLDRNGVRNEPGPVDVAYRDALTAYYAGRWSAAIDAFDRVLQIDPQHVQATEFRSAAVADRARFGDPAPAPAPGAPAVVWIGVAAAAAALGAVVALLVVRRRHRAVPVPVPPIPTVPEPRRPQPGPAHGPVHRLAGPPRPAPARHRAPAGSASAPTAVLARPGVSGGPAGRPAPR